MLYKSFKLGTKEKRCAADLPGTGSNVLVNLPRNHKCAKNLFCMPLFSSSKDNEYEDDATCEWPPKFQSFEEYKAELDEAVALHPPFGVWLRMYRNANHIGLTDRTPPMWELPVQQLKKRYLQSTNLNNRMKNAKRAFIEMHLEENKESCEKEESELEPKLQSYALALDSYNQARSHGYRNIPRPQEPSKTSVLLQRDALLAQLKQLVDPTELERMYGPFAAAATSAITASRI